MALRKVFVPDRDEVAEDWRKLRKDQLFHSCSLSNVIRVTISEMGRTYLTRRGREVHSGFEKGNVKERDNLEDLEEDYNLILQSKLK